MHNMQERLIALSKSHDLSRVPLRKIAVMVGEPGKSPSVIQHHFDQLEKNGLLFVDRKKKVQKHGNGYVSVSVMPDGRRIAFIPFKNFKLADVDGQPVLIELDGGDK